MTPDRDMALLRERLLLRPDQVARILNCSRRTVYLLIAGGQLRRTADRPYRVPADSVRAYLDGQGISIG